MKTNIFPRLILGFACMLLLLAACDKKAEKIAKKDDLARIGGGVSAFACTVKDTAINGSGTSFWSYGRWTPTVVPFPGPASTKLILQFEGFSNSFVRPVTNSGWFIGTLAKSDSCGTWTGIRSNIRVKNSFQGDFPDTTTTTPSGPVNFTYTPENVVGVSGTLLNKTYGGGYYSYVSGVPTVDSVLVAWKDSGPSWPGGNSVPSGLSAPEAYIISIHAFSVSGSGPYIVIIWYSYRKL